MDVGRADGLHGGVIGTGGSRSAEGAGAINCGGLAPRNIGEHFGAS